MPKRGLEVSHSLGKHNKKQRLMAEAMAGDMSISISPSTVTTDETSSAWTRKVNVKVVNSDSEKHLWLNEAFATTASIADTSSAGTATIPSTTLTLVEGEANIVVSGDAQDWLGGTLQEKSITCTGAPSSSGTITLTVTAAGMSNSPKAVEVELDHTTMTTVTLVADACNAALTADADVSSFFTVSNVAGAIKLTALAAAANDATMDIAFADTDTTSTTFGASADTTAGVAPETDTLTIGNLTIMGNTVTGGTSVETFSL